jgi:uncharacterized protein YdiU (UPF0061 family)
LSVLRAKLGLDAGTDDEDWSLADAWLELLNRHRIDFTLGFRRLVEAAQGDEAPLRALFGDAREAPSAWLERWRARLAPSATPASVRRASMQRANPIYIPRNHRVEAALEAAVQHGDLAPFERLLGVLEAPFEERAADAEFAVPAPPEVTARYRTFCGT